MAGWSRGVVPHLRGARARARRIPALVFAAQELRAGRARRVAVVCPTSPLTRQWARAAAPRRAAPAARRADAAAARRLPGRRADLRARGDVGAAEYARTCSPGHARHRRRGAPPRRRPRVGRGLPRGVRAGAALAAAVGHAVPLRPDADPGRALRRRRRVPDVSYTYADAVRDGVCRRVAFVPYDGTLQWQSGDDVIETSFDEVLTTREAGRRYRTAISTELPDGLPRILRAAHAKLLEVRAGGHRDAGGLVVTADSEHARAVAKALREITGVGADGRAAHRGRARTASSTTFRRGTRAVDRRGEHGLRGRRHPAPARRRLRDGRQDAADLPADRRALRARHRRAGRREVSYVFLPADRGLRALAADVETELRHVLRPPATTAGDELLDDDAARARRARRRPSRPRPAFVPLAADVAPQMALFAAPGDPPPRSPRRRPPRRPGAPCAEPEPEEPPLSAFETPRRAARRSATSSSRRCAASTAARSTRSTRGSTATLGVRKVETATIAQLEKSIELLHRELEKTSRRRRAAAARLAPRHGALERGGGAGARARRRARRRSSTRSRTRRSRRSGATARRGSAAARRTSATASSTSGACGGR